jgi:hypothetical protein
MTTGRRTYTAPVRFRSAGATVVACALLIAGCGGSGTESDRGASSAASAQARYGGPTLLGRLDDKAVAESSGLVASRRNPGLLWTHNDAGDGPGLYCVTREARRCGTWRVTNAEAQDWEDIATGPGPVGGEHYLYIGDIGDNDEARADVVVYRVPEPGAPSPREEPASTAPAEALRLRYEDGPRDAEALLVHPVSGDLFVVTKDRKRAGVYKATVGATVLTRIADFGLGGDEAVTGADISPDGTRVAVVSKAQAYEMSVPEGADFDDVWQQARHRVELAEREQGEAIAYRLDGDALLSTSEGSPMPLHEVTVARGPNRRD